MATGNKLLDKLPRRDFEAIENQLEPFSLPLKKSLCEPNEKITHVHFVTRGVVSMVNEPANGDVIEFATVGPEGMVGFPLLLAATSMPSRCFVQVAGEALRMKARDFQSALREHPRFNALLLRYTMALLNQIAQSTSCNRLHEVQERCARWLLQTQDRVDSDSFDLTQEFLAVMLGVHRPTVSIAAGMLQQAGLIEYTRGVITILDRKGLERASCNCYRIINKEYDRLLNGKG